MNGFVEACEIEKQGEAVLLPYMEKVWPDCTYYPTRHHSLIQQFCGDILTTQHATSKYIEFKVEKDYASHGGKNLFIETWSNRQRGTLGWFHKCQADWLWYYFLQPGELYIFPMTSLRQWAREPQLKPRLLDFPLRQQRRYEQLNDTWGHPVPVIVFQQELDDFRGPIKPTCP